MPLASAGGPEALAAVKSALEDKEESVQDEAVRTLSTWPNNWPEDAGIWNRCWPWPGPARRPPTRCWRLRGYLQYVQGDKQLKDDEKVGQGQ